MNTCCRVWEGERGYDPKLFTEPDDRQWLRKFFTKGDFDFTDQVQDDRSALIQRTLYTDSWPIEHMGVDHSCGYILVSQ